MNDTILKDSLLLKAETSIRIALARGEVTPLEAAASLERERALCVKRRRDRIHQARSSVESLSHTNNVEPC